MDAAREQLMYQHLGVTSGKGVIQQLHENGPFIVYSRTSPDDVLKKIQSIKPITSIKEMKTIFLLGPTPQFFGENKASTSWRRAFVEYLKIHRLNDSYLVVLPEPYSCDWKDVDYECFTQPMEHIYGQVHWRVQR